MAPDLIDGIWPIVSPFITRSFIKNDIPFPQPYLIEDLKSGRRVLWVLVRNQEEIIGAGVTCIHQMLNGKLCKIEHFGGDDMPEWYQLRRVIELYAKAEGCNRVMFEGRPGWRRVLKDYELTAVMLEKRL